MRKLVSLTIAALLCTAVAMAQPAAAAPVDSPVASAAKKKKKKKCKQKNAAGKCVKQPPKLPPIIITTPGGCGQANVCGDGVSDPGDPEDFAAKGKKCKGKAKKKGKCKGKRVTGTTPLPVQPVPPSVVGPNTA